MPSLVLQRGTDYHRPPLLPSMVHANSQSHVDRTTAILTPTNSSRPLSVFSARPVLLGVCYDGLPPGTVDHFQKAARVGTTVSFWHTRLDCTPLWIEPSRRTEHYLLCFVAAAVGRQAVAIDPAVRGSSQNRAHFCRLDSDLAIIARQELFYRRACVSYAVATSIYRSILQLYGGRRSSDSLLKHSSTHRGVRRHRGTRFYCSVQQSLQFISVVSSGWAFVGGDDLRWLASHPLDSRLSFQTRLSAREETISLYSAGLAARIREAALAQRAGRMLPRASRAGR